MASLAPGTQVGGYRIESVLGRGGMGVVYEATQLSLGRTVALKLLDTGLGTEASFQDRFRREARIQARLEHPHIVTVHEAGELPEGLYIAMRLIHGSDLKTVIRAGGLDPGRALRILGPVADALDAAHDSGLTHRDIKPQNILVGRLDHPFLADFGLTKAMGETGFTRTGQFLGTLDYVAPEQIRGEATRESDIYAFAAVAYECFTGQVPFVKPSEAALLWAHIAEPPPPATSVVPDLGAAVDAVLDRGLAKEAADRPATATALVEDLREALDAAVRATTAVAAQPPATPRPDRKLPPDAESAPRQRSDSTRTPATASAAVPKAEERPAAAPATVTSAPSPRPARVRRRPRSAVQRRRLTALAGGTVALLAVVLAVVLTDGDGGGDAPAAASTRPISGRAVTVRVPATWRALAEAPALGALRLRDAVAAAGGGGTVVAGRADGEGPTLLPAAFVKSLGAQPKGEAVRLGSAQAYRYAGLRPRGAEEPVTVFAVPMEADVATVACSGVAATACDAAAASLTVPGERLRPLGPSTAYAKAIRSVLSDLRGRRAPPLRRLGRAATSRGQAEAARAVAGAYARAGERARTVPTGPYERTATGRAADALEAAATAWGRLAAAARSRSRRRYADARRAVTTADRAASRAVAEFGRLGY